MKSIPQIKIILVDDHRIMLDGIKALLKGNKQVDIIAEFTRCESALEEISHLKPDIVITDVHLPGMNGIEFTKEIKNRYPGIKILALSMSDDEVMINEMLNVGISGYVIKNTGKEELEEAILKSMNDEVYLSPEIITTLSKSLLKTNKNKKESPKLTKREIEIVRLIAQEYSNEQIAKALFISERTVETHRKNIFRKTETKGVVGLLKYAMEQKII